MAIAVTACAAHEDVDLSLTIGDDVRAIVLGIERSETIEVQAIDVRGSQTALEVLDRYIGRYEVGLTAIEYTATIEELGLTPGPLEGVDEGIALPSGELRIMQTIVRGDAIEPWSESPTLPERMANFRIAGEGPDTCIEGGGCFDRTVSEGTVCVTPCPAQTDPDEPMPPTAPDFGTCPVGWSENFVDGVTRVCTPYPGGLSTCPSGETTYVDGSGCVPIGAPCPAGEWPEGLSGNIVYVRAGVTGGSGTIGDPLGSIQDAIGRAPAPATVALSKGRFEERITLRSDVAVVGACARETIIDNPGALGATVTAENGQLGTLRNLQIHGRQEGLEVDGAIVDVSGLWITETGDAGIKARNGGRVEGSQVAIGPDVKRGLFASTRGRIQMDHVVVDRAVRLGVFARDPGTRVVLSDVAVLNTQPDPTDEDKFGRGVDVEREGVVELTRAAVIASHDLGAFVSDGAQFLLRDGVVADTQPGPTDGTGGDAVHLLRGGVATLERAWIHDNHRYQIYAKADDATINLLDSVVSDALVDAGTSGGRALRLLEGSHLVARRSVLSRSVRHMVLADGTATLDLRDVLIRKSGVMPAVSNSSGGIRAEQDVRIEAERLRFEEVTGKALAVYHSSTASVADVFIEDAGGGTCHVCSGLCTHAGGQITGERIHVGIAYGRGINASDGESSLVLEDVRVTNGRAAPLCANSTRSPLKGDGIGTVDGGELTIERFVIEDNPGAGIVAEDYIGHDDPRQGVDARFGIVRRNTVGASLLIRNFELLRVTDRVQYEDNASALIVQ